MRKVEKISLIMGLLSTMFFAGCEFIKDTNSANDSNGGKGSGDSTSKSDIVIDVNEDSNVYFYDNSGNIDINMTNLNEKDVYFVLTNINKEKEITVPMISSSIVTSKSNSKNENELDKSLKESTNKTKSEFKQKIEKFNENPFKQKSRNLFGKKVESSSSNQLKSYSLNDSEVFQCDGDGNITATLRKVVEEHGVKLHVWVGNDEWTTTNENQKVNQKMIDEMTNKFLKSGENNDCYEWVVSVAGEAWGAHNNPDLIPNNKDIHILLYDIEKDGADGGIMGYFWAKDNFRKSYYKDSNEKIMFYIDSVFLTEAEGDWDINDSGPMEILSTLAHEFQHMIHFYQKSVKNNLRVNSPAWIDEMCAMAIEELLALKLGADGPRGVTFNDKTAGSKENEKGRPLEYNMASNDSLTNWNDSYGISYTYGAYLMRNFGGAKLINKIIQNKEVGASSVTEALKDLGYNQVDFDKSLRFFGAANLYSDSFNAPKYMKFNTGEWFNSSVNDIDYKIGSINLFNYAAQPKIHTVLNSQDMPYTSNIFYLAGNSLSGNHNWKIQNLDSNIKLSIVIK